MCSRQPGDHSAQSFRAGPAKQYPRTIGAGAQIEGRSRLMPATVARLSNARRTDVVVSRDGLGDVVIDLARSRRNSFGVAYSRDAGAASGDFASSWDRERLQLRCGRLFPCDGRDVTAHGGIQPGTSGGVAAGAVGSGWDSYHCRSWPGDWLDPGCPGRGSSVHTAFLY
jgi:hypothetical protein